jgi:PAS domain S-box-containing protein
MATNDGTDGDEPASGTDGTDRAGGPARYRRIVETIRDGVFTLDGEWNLVDVNRPLASMLGHDREALVGTHAAELIAPDGSLERARETWTALQRGETESETVVLTVRRADGERFPAEVRYGRFPLPDGGVGAVGVVRDVTDREERRAQLRRHRDQLARLNRIGDAAAAALDPVLEAGSRDAIERRVCERLADTDLYEVVWVGRPGGDGGVVPHTTCGADPTFHEVAERLIEESNHERSADRAFRSGEPVVHHEGWRLEVADVVREALDGTDIRATMALPLAYHGTTYGTLTAYSTREDAFSGDEREALLRLGRAVGFAINAVGTRRLVHAHERTELELRVGPSSSVLAAVSATLDAECVLRWTTPATGFGEERERERERELDREGGAEGSSATRPAPSSHDLWLGVDVEGIDAETVLAAAEEAGVVAARVAEETASGCTVELRVAESVPGAVVDAGARPCEVVAEAGRAHVLAEAPTDTDIRSVVEAFTDATDAELVAKRTRGNGSERESLSDSLTGKQREALRTAEAMGYFDWPREHTAEEVADRLGVASATLHYHLRAAQRTLVRAVLDAPDDEEP